MFNTIRGLYQRPLPAPDPHVLIVRIKGKYNPKTFTQTLGASVQKMLTAFLDQKGYACYKVQVRNAAAKQASITALLKAHFPTLQIKVTRAFPK